MIITLNLDGQTLTKIAIEYCLKEIGLDPEVWKDTGLEMYIEADPDNKFAVTDEAFVTIDVSNS